MSGRERQQRRLAIAILPVPAQRIEVFMTPNSTPIDASLHAADAAVVTDRAPAATMTERLAAEVATRTETFARAVRLDSVDLLRGLVMVIMALDHTRDFFHHDALLFDPTDLSKTTPALFLTRWITHFCAPVFVFLAGTGAYLSLARGKTKRDLSWFLVTRGVWLVVLELTLVRLGWTFDLSYGFTFVQVIWALGWSMIVLAALIHLPLRAIAGFGLIMIGGHNLLDRVHAGKLGSFRLPWLILHEQGPMHWGTQPPGGFTFLVQYPLIPWIGVMAVGYCFGRLLQLPVERRRKVLLRLGLALTLAFIVIRATNLYGDPQPWAAQQSPLFTLFSFINCQKYPPSLLYLLMTLGPAIALLPFLERWTGALANFFRTFGRVPLFYYLLHLFLIHLLAVIFAFARYGKQITNVFANGPPPDFGYNLLVVYLVWLGAVLLLYPPCRWWARLKQHRRSAWLSYL
jgi:uncharacterized membrane protein